MNKFVLLAWGAIASLVLTGCGGSSSSSSPPPPAAVTPSVFTIGPDQVALMPGNSLTFYATITGTGNTAVNWTVQEGATGGSIDSGGHYTAPLNNGTFHVIATSQADPGQSATATVNVAGTLVVSVFPSSDLLGPSGVRAFAATVPVTWSVQEGAAGGAITTDGVYTAPTAGGPFHVVATSVQDPSKNTVAQATVVSSGFRPTGAMGTARTAHTATLLKDGRVLITGGNSCYFGWYESCPLNSAEIYDPGTGTFSATGKMLSDRYFHTATLLNNGLVLVTGGGSATAELYDPASGAFSPTGSTMSVGRTFHTATLLADGKVLIAGGLGALGGDLATAELYDPITRVFTATGNMTVQRWEHTGTLLANGKVLLAGGLHDSGALPTAELYDPATGSFILTGSMAGKRHLFSAALLGNSGVLVAGGGNGTDSLSSAEVYDVATGTFTATGSMMAAREPLFAIPLTNGKVLVSGADGWSSDWGTAELYDAGGGSFTQTGSMAKSRGYPAAVLLMDGRVLVTGGSDSSSAELFQ